MFGTQGQPLGQAVSRTGSRRSTEQARTGSQTDNGLLGRGSRTACRREGQAHLDTADCYILPVSGDSGKIKIAEDV